MKEYHYTYLLIDPVTGQFYIGSRTCKGVTPQEDKYMGSMCAWKPEDKSRLKKTILREFSTREEADYHEGKLQKLFINDPLNENYYIQTVGFSTHGLPGPNKKNKEIFIQQATEVHGDIYDYSLVDYVDTNTHVNIKCQTHGVFPQTPNKHINSKNGCPKCLGVRNTEMFIEKAKQIHGDKYGYLKVNYIDSHTEVIIHCPEHGDFPQNPTNHINNKNGCKYCATTFKDTTESYVIKAKLIYGDKYDYSKVCYVNSHTDIIINCPEHGDFPKNPGNHLHNNQGCTECGIIEGRIKQRESLIKSGKVKGSKNPSAKKVINIKTMEVYDCAEEVAKLLNITGNKLRRMLRGERINRTDFIYQ
jgi:hypothetical protein